MNMIQVFVLDRTLQKVKVKKSGDKTLYLASDITRILGVQPVREVYLDNKVVISTGKTREEFITEDGVYRLLMDSNKPIAQPFQKWVTNVIRTIGGSGKYDLRHEIQELKESRKRFLEYKLAKRRQRTHSVLLER